MRLKLLSESLRRSWPSWVAQSIPVLVVIVLVVIPIRIHKRKATVEWIYEKGGSVAIEPGWLSLKIPPDARSWLDGKLGGAEWSKPFDAVTTVRLDKTEIEQDDLKRLRVFKNFGIFRDMDTLVLDHLSETGAEHLSGFSDQLKSLSLWRSTIDDDGVEAISRFHQLESLLINSTQITDTGMEHIGNLSRLQTLRLFSAPKVTDAGLAHLGGLSNLAWLHLGDSRIEGAGLVHLKGLSKLENLDLRGCSDKPGGLPEPVALGSKRHERYGRQPRWFTGFFSQACQLAPGELEHHGPWNGAPAQAVPS